MTDEELMNIARPYAADGGRWPSDWIDAMRKAAEAEREACAVICEDRFVGSCANAIRRRSNVKFTPQSTEKTP